MHSGNKVLMLLLVSCVDRPRFIVVMCHAEYECQVPTFMTEHKARECCSLLQTAGACSWLR